MITTKTPRQCGYRMPAEWEEHEATWLSWPNKRLAHYWGERFSGVEDIYMRIIGALHGSEKVHLQIFDEEMEKDVQQKLQKAGIPLEHILFFETKNLDVWTRDHGPLFVVNREGNAAITHWIFNGWGKYIDLAGDTSVPGRLHQLTGLPYFSAGMVLEGGSVETNGKGVLMTTKQCLFHAQRNPYAQDRIEQTLKDYLGVEEILWLNKGLYKDDTAGHIDNIARFTATNRILCVRELHPWDKNYRALEQNLKIVQAADYGFEVATLPTPGVIEVDGERRAASYANFYIGNKVVLVPVFGVKEQDKTALNIIRDQFPGRNIIPINCLDLIASGGTIHCVTQQQPKGYNWKF